MSLAIRDSSSTASRVCDRAWVVESAAVETPVMFVAISVEPPAASCTDRDISLVVAVCSSTALAMVSWKSLIDPMISPIRPIASTAPPVALDGLHPPGDVPWPAPSPRQLLHLFATTAALARLTGHAPPRSWR